MADAVHDAVLTFSYADRDRARIVERSVGREVGEIAGDRTRTTLDRDGATVEASDLVALRAGLNTWTTLVAVAERTAGP